MTSPPNNSHTLSDIFFSTSRPSSPPSSSHPSPSFRPSSPSLMFQLSTSPPSGSTSHPSPHSRPHSSSSSPSYFASPPSPSTTTSPSSPRTPNPDIHRLQTTHRTAGYRDGISSAKTSFLQRGFDEGYALGAELGLRVGFILGVLEGILRAVAPATATASTTSGDGDGDGVVGERASVSGKKVLEEARRELVIEKVFDREWWDEDGVWRFGVGDFGGEGEGGDGGGGGGRGGEVTFQMVAEEHPLLKRWMERLRTEMGRVGVSEWGRFEGDEWEKGRVGEEEEGNGLV